MNVKQLRAKARVPNVKSASRLRKPDLIRAIQKAEGNFDCFGTANGYCDQQGCTWRRECVEE